MKHLTLVFAMMLMCISMAFAQRTVSGTVTDESGSPLPFANVFVEGTTVGTTTDIDGNYTLKVPEGASTLVVAYTGYGDMKLGLGDSNSLNFTMAQGVVLDDIVVTALGIAKEERSLGYSVQEVESEEILGANETNLVEALAGKAAGLQITNSSGAAGGSSYALIRGVRTISGDNQPLFVIDGVPIDNSQLRSGDAVASVAVSNRAIDINQADIASISVLKGAAATALYGSQAGNGAIVITTKTGATKGDSHKISVELGQTISVNRISQTPELQTEYAQGLFGSYAGPESGSGYSYGPAISALSYANDAGTYAHDKNGSIVLADDPTASGRAVNSYDRYGFFQDGVSSKTNLAVSGSNPKSSFRLSLGYSDEQGVIPRNEFKKINVGLNASTKMHENITVSTNIQYINSGGTRIEQGSNTSGVMLGLTRTSPTFDNANGLEDPVNDESAYTFPDGSQRNYRGGGGYDNPYWTINNNPLNDNVDRIIANIRASWNITDWLSLSYQPGIDYYYDTRSQYFAIGSRTNQTGKVLEDVYKSLRLNSDLILRGSYNFTEDIGATLTLGHNMFIDKLDNLYLEGTDLVIPGFYDLSNASSYINSISNSEIRKSGVYGMLDLNYKRMLYLTLTGRLDSDSSLPDASNPFPYYSGSLGFVFTEALGLADSKVFPFGKLRVSYGTVGLGAPSAYLTNTVYVQSGGDDGWTTGIGFPYMGEVGFTLSDRVGNPELKPERNTSFETGIDLRFFNGRITLDAAYYRDVSNDVIIVNAPVAPSIGSTSQTVNAASLSNTGFEVVLNATPVKKPLTWDIGVNFTKNENLVEELAEGVESIGLGGFTGATTRAVAGLPYATIFGFGWYRDANDNVVIGPDGFPMLDPNEKAFSSAQPEFTVGLRNTLSYKGLSLSWLFDFKKGGTMWNGTKSALYFWGTHQETADLRNTVKVFEGSLATGVDANGAPLLGEDGVPLTNGANDIAVLIDENWLAFGNANGFFGDNTEDYIEDTSWIRLRDVSLSYALGSNIIQKTPFRSGSLVVSGRNLWLSTPYTGVDPSTNLYGASNAQGLDYFNMPGTRSVTVGLNLGF